MVKMINEEQRVTLYQDYVTMALKILAESYSTVHGGSLSLPSFIEMTHAKPKEESAQEVKDRVKKLFAK